MDLIAMGFGVTKVAVAAVIVGIPVRVLANRVKKVMTLKEEVAKEYVTKDKHVDLCQIASLEMRKHISEEIGVATEKILSAIKANGST